MAFGLIPAKGPWTYEWFTTDSAATFPKGAAVNLGSDYELEEYASTDSQWLGIAMSYSTQSSLRFNGSVLTSSVMVAIPSPGCYAWSDLTTGVTNSALSRGKRVNLYKQGNYASYASTVIGEGSRFSALLIIAGPVLTDTSQVLVNFVNEALVYYSASSATFAT